MNTLNNTPLVSVIVPVYNVEQYIDDCLNSIRQQTYTNLEIIIVEDCSTDNSDTAITPHLTDKRIKVIHHKKNSGLSAARNTGIDAATGEFIMFVDSDDLIDLNLIQLCVQSALEAKAEVVLFHEKPFEDGENIKLLVKPNNNKLQFKSVKQEDYFRYQHFAWLKFIRTDLIHSNSLKFPIGYYYEDWPFHWELGFITSNMVDMHNGIYHYRQRKDSITGSADKKLLHIFFSQKLILQVINKYQASLETKYALSNKIYRGMTYVLKTIDDEYLEEAVIVAKQHLRLMSKTLVSYSPSLESRLFILCLKLPTPAALATIRGMRSLKNKIRTNKVYTTIKKR